MTFYHPQQEDTSMRRNNKRKTLVGLLTSVAFFLFIFEKNSLHTDTRRLEESALYDPAEQLSNFYKLVFNPQSHDDSSLEMQKQVRIRRECEAHPDLDTPPEEFVGTDHIDSHLTTISCVPVHYRIPTSSVQGVENSMVFGVLSDVSEGRTKRDSIRITWGQENTVFFVIAGDWKDIEDEYTEYRDILWVDQPDIYRTEDTIARKGALTFKSEAFLIAMHNQVVKQNPNVEYFFKTDDDSYIDVHYLKQMIDSESELKPVDYWGRCHDRVIPTRFESHKWYASYKDYPFAFLPAYCFGSGYVISPKFLECMVGEGHVEKVPYLTVEDSAVGLLAEKCGIEPLMNWLTTQVGIPEDLDFMKKMPVYKGVNSDADMLKLHESFLRKWSEHR